MTADTVGQRLHDRATRREILSAEEPVQLDAWYARLDREEAAALADNQPPPRVAEPRTQIQASLTELAAAPHRNEALAADNAALRQEIAALQQRALLRFRLPPEQ